MLEQVEFDAAPPLPGERRFWAMSLSGGVVQLDIDNDGIDEHVFSVTFDSSAGRGCSAGYLAVYQGVAYVDARSRAGDRTLYRIDAQQVTTVCEFRAVPGYDVAGDSPSPPRQSQDRLTSPP